MKPTLLIALLLPSCTIGPTKITRGQTTIVTAGMSVLSKSAYQKTTIDDGSLHIETEMVGKDEVSGAKALGTTWLTGKGIAKGAELLSPTAKGLGEAVGKIGN